MKKTFPPFALLVLIFFSGVYSVKAQVVINEFSCSNKATIADNFGSYEDWVELYNAGASPASIGGYHLTDNPSNLTKYVIPAITIPAGGYQLFFCSGKNTVSGTYYHTNFKLTQTKYEHIILSNAAAVIQDSITTFPTLVNNSRGRSTDGAGTWGVFLSPNPGAANTGASIAYEPRPQMSIAAGFYTGTITVAITDADPSAQIFYTLNGKTPTNTPSATNFQYVSPLSISGTYVIRARAFSTNPNYAPSFVESNTYFLNVSHTVAVVSVFGDQTQTLISGTQMNTETGLEYFDKTGTFRTESYGTANKHGNDSWSYAQRGIDFVTYDIYGYSNVLDYKIFSRKTRDKFQRVILKAAANDNYPSGTGGTNGPANIRDSYVMTLAQRANLHLDCRTWEPVVLYVNGNYWGVYDIREKVDDNDYTNYYYNQDDPNIQMLQTWGGTWSAYGGTQAQTDWNSMVTYITTNNMAIAANYNYVDSLYNVKSLVDYMVLNSYVVCSDWLNWNTMWWRGTDPNGSAKKWKYCLWDEDATFGHYINYTGLPSQAPTADPCNPQSLNDPGGQGHVPILNALLANPTFKQYYISRFIDLNNSYLKCSYMEGLLDSMIGCIQPEMQRHCVRWGGNTGTWLGNVQTMKDWITQRCASINAGLMSCYTLNGPYPVTFIADPPGDGSIQVNSMMAPASPYSGDYFGGITVLLKAIPVTNGVFINWTSNHHAFSPDSANTDVSISLTQGDTVIAHFSMTGVDEVKMGNLSMKVYPSLVSNSFFVEYENKSNEAVTVDIYSISGQHSASVASDNQARTGKVKQEINPHEYGLSPGMYIVTCRNSSSYLTQKIVYIPTE